MEPLLDTTNLPPLPAPFWFIEFFKVLGFSLHAIPMNLWYAGILVALGLAACGSEHGRRFAARLMLQMPVIVALGINFGIVPLLFLQLAYARAFYPATILMAWFWLAVVVLLVPAYYGVYLYAFGLGKEGAAMTPLKRAAGWLSAVFFVWIGFTFANGLSLTTRVERWRAIWLEHNLDGAATGWGLNLSDPSLWPRWLLMFGLALVTTAAWMVVDAAWLAPRESRQYKRWAQDFALRLGLVGAAWAAVAGTWYVFGTWPPEVFQAMFRSPQVILTLLTAASPWAVGGLLWLWRRGDISRGQAAAVGAGQVGTLALNAIGRQVVQNLEVRPLVDALPEPAVQWGPMAMFLLALVAGALAVAWILIQIIGVKASPEAAP